MLAKNDLDLNPLFLGDKSAPMIRDKKSDSQAVRAPKKGVWVRCPISPDSHLREVMVTRAAAKRIKLEASRAVVLSQKQGKRVLVKEETFIELLELNAESGSAKLVKLEADGVDPVETNEQKEGNKREVKIKQEIAVKTEFQDTIGANDDVPMPVKNYVKSEVPDSKPPNVFSYVGIEDIELVPAALAPKNWDKVYNLVVDMRAKFMSPVDTMGCERIPVRLRPQGFDSPRTYRFQLLISLMLSSQTKDEVNYAAMKTLDEEMTKRGFANGLCLEAVLATLEIDINTCIQKVGFHHRKAGYIKRACQMLVDNHEGDIPKTIAEIVALPGVGPKMGYLLLQRGWNQNDGIGVDVHIHRLAQMWNWTSSKARTPEHTRLELELWLPQRLWGDINPLLVGFGQVICPPNYGNCDVCALGKQKLCPKANRKLVNASPTPARLATLGRQRADLLAMVAELHPS